MHNGVVGGFSKIKRRLLDQLSDAAYNSIQSFHSDSAVSFAVFLNHLPDLVQHQQPNVLLNAMQVGGGGSWGTQTQHVPSWCGVVVLRTASCMEAAAVTARAAKIVWRSFSAAAAAAVATVGLQQ
jgi:predicted glutamine amidotransferase